MIPEIRESRSRFTQLPVERACTLLEVSRQLYYRQATPAGCAQAAQDERRCLEEAMERIVLEFPGYGYRRVTAQLARQGWSVNHKRVLRLMRQAGWLCRLRWRWIKTTDSAHGLCVYPNLVKAIVPDGLNQVWVADLTYIRLRQGLAYLATLLDAFSRKVIGWQLTQHLDARLVLTALEQALRERQPMAELIHHSDRGVQYACRDYVERLLAAGARISMAAKGSARENAQAASFLRTLKMEDKMEEVYLQEYHCFEEADASIENFIEAVYNRKRLHSSLGYVPPEEFENSLAVNLAT